MRIEGVVLAAVERKVGERIIRTVDVEGLELGISDPDVKSPLEGTKISARVYVHWIASPKGTFCVRDIKEWRLAP